MFPFQGNCTSTFVCKFMQSELCKEQHINYNCRLIHLAATSIIVTNDYGKPFLLSINFNSWLQYNGSGRMIMIIAGWFNPKILIISRLQLQLEYQKFALKTMRFTGTVIISGFILGWWLLIFICIDCIIKLKVYFLRQNFG